MAAKTRKVKLKGGAHHGRVVTILHGRSIIMGGDHYERPKRPAKTPTGAEIWPVKQVDHEAA